jgi:hypothetical protein
MQGFELVGLGGGGGRVDASDSGSEQHHEQGKERTRRDKGGFDAEPRDEGGDEGRTDADRGEPDHLDDSEDPRENVVRDGALDEREPGDVHE